MQVSEQTVTRALAPKLERRNRLSANCARRKSIAIQARVAETAVQEVWQTTRTCARSQHQQPPHQADGGGRAVNDNAPAKAGNVSFEISLTLVGQSRARCLRPWRKAFVSGTSPLTYESHSGFLPQLIPKRHL